MYMLIHHTHSVDSVRLKLILQKGWETHRKHRSSQNSGANTHTHRGRRSLDQQCRHFFAGTVRGLELLFCC